MTEEFIGSVVVTHSSKIIGLFTERDLMMRVVGKRKDPEKVKIKDVMSESLLTIGPWLLPQSDEGTQMPTPLGLRRR